MGEIYSFPASEIVGWEEYFSIYPFTQDREDARTALLASTIASVIWGKPIKLEKFLPDYLGKQAEKSLREQQNDWDTFKQRYKKIVGESKRE